MMALDLVPANHRADWRIHRVVPGETLAEIAHRYATPVSALTSANQRGPPPEARPNPETCWWFRRAQRVARAHARAAPAVVSRGKPAAPGCGCAPDAGYKRPRAGLTPAPTTPPAWLPNIAPRRTSRCAHPAFKRS